MVDFLTTMQVASTIETIIRKAKAELNIVSPFLRVSDAFLERLIDADEREITIKIIFGKNELKNDELEKLKAIKNLELYYYENLHAKCYFNESMMVITSMNFHEYSQQRNREMGIKITKAMGSDRKVYDEAVEEVQSILKKSTLHSVKFPEIELQTSKKANSQPIRQKTKSYTQKGYCLRCREVIQLNPDKPYCYDCYKVWEEFENYDYLESYCHSCGKYEDTTMNKPLCYHCYKKMQK